MEIKKVFGRNLRKARENRNLSQEKLAELIEIGPPALSNIECGKTYPKIETIKKIVEVFNIKLHLLYLTDEQIDVEQTYKESLNLLKKAKEDEQTLKVVHDFLVENVEI